MVLKILQIGNPILETKAKQVDDIKQAKIQKLIDDMLDTCIAKSDKAAGLSAPQVGEPLRISICRRFDLSEDSDEWEVMINPELISESSDTSVVWEGCLSIGVGAKALYGPVIRPKKVRVRYQDREGQTKELDGENYFSHVIQHEIDHLNGILFLKHIKNPDKNIWTSKELDNYIAEYNGFPDAV